MKILYSWINKEYFDSKLSSIDEVADALLFHSFEIEGIEKVGKDDAVFDIDVLPNRAHDCLSHRGIAKELSVILGIPFLEKTIEANFTSIDATLNVSVEEKELCDRYIGRVLRNVEIKDSPDWLKHRLESLGQRSINALVDATNYVLLDIGQPTHAFDLDKIDGANIRVRMSTGEEMQTLDGNKIELKDTDLVIATDSGPLAIAGVKGGKRAEVTGQTKNIVLESAHFNPLTVRKTSRRLAIMTDSSKRFENEPTPELAGEAMEYLTRLIVSLCGTPETVVEHAVDEYQEKELAKKVVVDTDHINKLLGTQLADQEVSNIFDRFGWDYQKTGDEFSVSVPVERLDIENSADLVEEVGRIYGYKNINSQELPPINNLGVNKEFYYLTQIKQALVKSGFSEVYTGSFQAKGKLKMANPVAQDRPYLRDKIDLKGVFEINVRNKDLLGLEEIKIFEIGKVFDEKANEKLVLSLRVEKQLKENPLEEFGIDIAGCESQIDLDTVIGKLAEVTSYDDLEFAENNIEQYAPSSVYPFVVRDISVWVSKAVKRKELIDVIKDKAGELLIRDPSLVDEYSKDDRISYAHRLVFQSFEKTLTDLEVGNIMEKIESAIAEKGWEVR